jgi:D-alanyl-D-alanine carboxypeptidase (penicillin-binding protein 5/6)
LSLGCVSGIVIDGETGRVLYEKNGYEKRAMASTTKIMTCIIALENCNPKEVVTVSKNAVGMPKVRMDIRAGEQYLLKDLLCALMLESYNDVAVAVAEHVGGSVKGFGKKMNRKAKELGMCNSHFVTPNGLDAKGHYSTAYDMALLGAYAIKNKTFRKIIHTKNLTIQERKSGRRISLYNRDAYLSMDRDAIGIKTGFTNQAGYCFVGAVKSNGATYVSCVLGSGWPPARNQKWVDTKSLMAYGKKWYHPQKIVCKKKFQIPIQNGKFTSLNAISEGAFRVLKRKDERLRHETKYFYNLPVRKNQVIGYTKVYINDFYFGKMEIRSSVHVPIYNYAYCFRQIWKMFI